MAGSGKDRRRALDKAIMSYKGEWASTEMLRLRAKEFAQRHTTIQKASAATRMRFLVARGLVEEKQVRYDGRPKKMYRWIGPPPTRTEMRTARKGPVYD